MTGRAAGVARGVATSRRIVGVALPATVAVASEYLLNAVSPAATTLTVLGPSVLAGAVAGLVVRRDSMAWYAAVAAVCAVVVTGLAAVVRAQAVGSWTGSGWFGISAVVFTVIALAVALGVSRLVSMGQSRHDYPT